MTNNGTKMHSLYQEERRTKEQIRRWLRNRCMTRAPLPDPEEMERELEGMAIDDPQDAALARMPG